MIDIVFMARCMEADIGTCQPRKGMTQNAMQGYEHAIQDGKPAPRVLMTGITGFIGGRLAKRLLANGWAVHALIRSSSRRDGIVSRCATWHHYDGTGQSIRTAIAATRPDIVMHLATAFSGGRGTEDAERLVAANVLFPTQLAEAMLAENCTTLINTGSFWQHSGADGLRPFDLYAATKTALEQLLSYYQDADGLTCVTLSLYDTYGPDDPRRKIIPLLLDAIRTDEVLDLSPGDQILDLTHVDDVARAFEIAARVLLGSDQPFGRKVHVSGERLSLRQLVNRIEQVGGRPVPVRLGARPYRPHEIMVPIIPGPTETLPDWRPAYTLDMGLKQLINSAP